MNKKLQINRRKFVSSLGLAGVTGIPAFSGSSAFQEKPVQIMKCGPYLQAANSDSISVRWITHLPCYSWVEYGENPQKLDQKINCIDDGLIRANNTVHAFTLRPLRPGTRYYYRIVSRRIDDFHPYKLKYGETYTGNRIFVYNSRSQTKGN